MSDDQWGFLVFYCQKNPRSERAIECGYDGRAARFAPRQFASPASVEA